MTDATTGAVASRSGPHGAGRGRPGRYPETRRGSSRERRKGIARVQWHDLIAGIAPEEPRGDRPVEDRLVEVLDIVHDSRRARPGVCFACIPGARVDGHDHAAAAVAQGAVALLVERPLPLGVPQAQVGDVRAVLGPLAARLHGDPSRTLRCLGVTGTNGKTTVTYLLESIAGALGEQAGVIGTIGARVGRTTLPTGFTTPEASDLQALLADMRDRGVTTVAVEVSSHALAQGRVDGVAFAAACFTNVSHEHLDFHGTLEAYFAAKASLFDPVRTPAAAINLDDEHGRRLAAMARERGLDVWTFGIATPGADLSARDIVPQARGTALRLHDVRADTDAVVTLSLAGVHNVSNALAAAATARAAGIASDAVVAGLSTPVIVPGRMERVDVGQPFEVLVDYAHTPDALSSVLDAARELTAGRLIVVFGCGGDRDREKRPLMGAAVASRADLAILTSDNPRSERPDAIAAAVLDGMAGGSARVFVELDRRVAIESAIEDAAPGDVVVIAGKGHESGQTIGEQTFPFDDRVVARAELERSRWS